MLTSRETPRDSLRNMDHVYFFRLVEFSHPQTACRRNRMSTWPHSYANKKKVCFTQSQGFHFFLARHSSSLICIRVPTNNLSWWSSGHLTPNAKKTTWMFGAKTDPWDLGVEHVTLQILTLISTSGRCWTAKIQKILTQTVAPQLCNRWFIKPIDWFLFFFQKPNSEILV